MGFLDFLGGPGGLVGGVGSILGTINSANEARNAQRARELAIQQYQMAGLQGLEGNSLNDARGQYGAAGSGSDAIFQGSRNLGSSLAAGGVYNPSVVAGATLQGQQGLNTSLADLAERNRYNQQQGLASLNSNVANMRLGVANQDYGTALGQQGYARQGLSSFLGALSQNNLARSGANANRLALPTMNGNQNQASALPGVDINNYPYGTQQAPQYSTPSMMPQSYSAPQPMPAAPQLTQSWPRRTSLTNGLIAGR